MKLPFDDMEIGGLPPGVRWAVSVRIAGGEPVEMGAPDDALHTASVGKVLLLIAIARKIEAGELDPSEELAREPEDAVADSGIWQHLRQERLRIDDLATLIGSVSDNLGYTWMLRFGSAIQASNSVRAMRRSPHGV